MTKGAKLGIILVLGLGGFFGVKWFAGTETGQDIMSSKEIQESKMINQIILPDAPKTSQGTNVLAVEMPSDALSTIQGKTFNFEVMAWSAQNGMMFSNGGAQTTKGSLIEKYGVKANIMRQDDCNKMQQDLIKNAQDYKENPSETQPLFVCVMGDGYPAFLAGLNSELEKLGTEYCAKAIFSMGKSLGEDKLMGPKSWKENPQSARGGVVAAYLRDGDWNIVVKWCSDNGIPVNPDEKTYDPDAMNFIAANDFIDAAQKYIAGYTEDRKVVKNGKRTGDKKTITVDGVATWTPGDVMIAENKGGIVDIVSTAEYRSQMPNVMIGIGKILQDNRKDVENLILAIAEGGDQVKTYDNALKKACEINAKVYNEKDANYWYTYYKGETKADKQGLIVKLGGSRVHNLSDNLELFGLAPGSANVYKSVYTVFGDIVSGLYPDLVPTYPKFEDAVDLSYIKNISSKPTNITSADKVKYNANDGITNVVSKKGWSIEFETGSANFTQNSLKTLEELFNQTTVSSGLGIEIFGHTDNTGTVSGNMDLSQQRADAVKKWLMGKNPNLFPGTRFGKVLGRGQSEPVADNSSNSGRSKNRRVEIVLGN
jgi:outer membrane protein OmpA-like peptidoglycan-associated protein